MPEGGCDPVGSPVLEQAPGRTCGPRERGPQARAGLLAGLVTSRGIHAGAACSCRIAPLVRTHTGVCREDLQPMGRIHVGKFCGELSPMRETSCWSGERVKSPLLEEEGAAETMCDELTVTPIPRPPVLLGGRRKRNGSEAEPGKKGGLGEDDLRSSFLSYYPTLI